MSAAAKQFIGGAFALIALFLLLTHSGGLARGLQAGAAGSVSVFKTLQGR